MDLGRSGPGLGIPAHSLQIGLGIPNSYSVKSTLRALSDLMAGPSQRCPASWWELPGRVELPRSERQPAERVQVLRLELR